MKCHFKRQQDKVEIMKSKEKPKKIESLHLGYIGYAAHLHQLCNTLGVTRVPPAEFITARTEKATFKTLVWVLPLAESLLGADFL